MSDIVEAAVAELERIAKAIADIHDSTVGPSAAGGHAIDQALNRFPEAVAALRAVLDYAADLNERGVTVHSGRVGKALQRTVNAHLGGAS